MKKIIFISILTVLALANVSSASSVDGRILLQVEENGEGWYVHPLYQKRYFLGRPQDAFEVMRKAGVGISDQDLAKIPVAESSFSLIAG